jgi:hypothetical protein
MWWLETADFVDGGPKIWWMGTTALVISGGVGDHWLVTIDVVVGDI